MSREIKFRAWNNKHKEMYYSHSAKKEKITEYQKIEIFFKVLEEYKKEFKNPDQYTGLKDKNGVEIYEGDVVECQMSFNGGFLPHMGEIVYIKRLGAFATKNQAGETLLHNHLLSSFEVIGNVHENPGVVTS